MGLPGTFNKTERAQLDMDDNDAFLLSRGTDENNTLLVMYQNSVLIYSYYQIMRIENDTQYLLPPPASIVNDTSDMIMKLYPGPCRIHAINEYVIQILCTRPKVLRIQRPPAVATLLQLFTLLETRPLKRGLVPRKYKDFKILIPVENFKVGTIDRPRVCIIPALIMFLSVFAVASIVRFTKGKQDLAFKQWVYISLCYGSYNSENPLYSECKEFVEWKVGGNMGCSQHQLSGP